ncbi:MAG: hypothetical protein O7I42_10590 [Alphaproteobacteria bacterium]|nr:hypothetical protein [Alphaproteobacteria bacterium]
MPPLQAPSVFVILTAALVFLDCRLTLAYARRSSLTILILMLLVFGVAGIDGITALSLLLLPLYRRLVVASFGFL